MLSGTERVAGVDAPALLRYGGSTKPVRVQEQRRMAMRDPTLVSFAKDMLGMPDEEIEKVTPEQEQEYKNTLEKM